MELIDLKTKFNDLDMVLVNDVRKIKSPDFDKESDLSDYIESNIGAFCRDVLSDEYIDHQREFQVTSKKCFVGRLPRADLVIECKKKKYIIELKNPKQVSENRCAIGQVLCYSALLDLDESMELVILTTNYDLVTAKTIKKFDLPIRYVYFDKVRTMEYLHDA